MTWRTACLLILPAFLLGCASGSADLPGKACPPMPDDAGVADELETRCLGPAAENLCPRTWSYLDRLETLREQLEACG